MALIYGQTHMRVGFTVTMMEYFLDVDQEDVLLLSKKISSRS